MMSSSNTTNNTILNILTQVRSTTIDIGAVQGHYISTAQLNAILTELGHSQGSQLSAPPSYATFDTDSSDSDGASLALRKSSLERRIRRKIAKLNTANSVARVQLNLELGQLRSELARIVRGIRQQQA